MSLAPIVLFVYNRPTHTERVIEALKKDLLSKESKLYIFSDAPKDEKSIDTVGQVRDYLSDIRGFESVVITKRDKNYGLSKSIISGVTELCNQYGRIIVLEDDIVVSPFFLSYMNSALDIYEREEKVMHISGYMFPVAEPQTLPESFFYRATSCWGWATWKRAWDLFESDSRILLSQLKTRDQKYEFNVRGTLNYYGMLKAQAMGKLDSWAVRWYASLFRCRGLCLHPAYSLVDNIGHDGSGVHCDESDRYKSIMCQKPIAYFPREITESNMAVDQIASFFSSLKQPIYVRAGKLAVRVLNAVKSS